jgi:hypothetical protein
LKTETHSSQIKELINDASLTFTGKHALTAVEDSYEKALRRFDIPSIKAAIERLTETHTYRTLPLPAEIIKIIEDRYDKKQRNFVVRTPQFMVFLSHPRSKVEMTRYLKKPRIKKQAYDAILEWNRLKPREKEERWEAIELGREKTAANIKRVHDNTVRATDAIEADERVDCCICGKETLKYVSVNEYLKLTDPDSIQGVDQYACHMRGCMKKLLKNAG